MKRLVLWGAGLASFFFLVSCGQSRVGSTLSASTDAAIRNQGVTDYAAGAERDAVNPWYIQNTKRVTYCLADDGTTFQKLPTPLSKIVKDELNYWKDAFAKGADTAPDYKGIGKIQIATQEFAEVPCTEDADLRFQFGVLTPEQQKSLANPKDFIAVAVRTSYDQENLHAKGFVYVSPDSGALRYGGTNLVDGAWHLGKGYLLNFVLRHELGHVFGLPHVETFGIMKADFPAWMLEPGHTMGYDTGNVPFGNFDFEFQGNFEPFYSQTKEGVWHPAEFFGIPQGYKSLSLDVGDKDKITFYSFPENSRDGEVIGEIDLDRAKASVEFRTLVKVNITGKQKVFPQGAPSLFDRDEYAGPRFISRLIPGEYHSTRSELTRSVLVYEPFQAGGLGFDSFRVGGVVDGQIRLDVLDRDWVN